MKVRGASVESGPDVVTFCAYLIDSGDLIRVRPHAHCRYTHRHTDRSLAACRVRAVRALLFIRPAYTSASRGTMPSEYSITSSLG